MNKLKTTFAIIFSVLFSSVSFSQEKLSISGTVKDASGEPVIGAVVMLEGSASVGTVTGADGKYTINIPSNKANPQLTVSCISYQAQTVSVGKRSVIDFVLSEDKELLDEVVVVGYGAMRRSDLTGSVTSVKIEEGDAERSTSLDQLLQGRAAGVQVTHDNASPDGGMTVHIRGMSSFNGSSEPLYVVDGIIINASGENPVLLAHGQDNAGSDEANNGLMGLNPSDIASIEILKDASATAIYGAEGANGVILITTKQATNDRPSIKFSSGVDLSRRYKTLDVMNLREYCDFEKRYDYETGKTTGYNIVKKIWSDPENYTGLLVEEMNWQDYVMRTAVSQRYHVSISGKPKQTSYMFSLGYSNKTGIVRKSSAEQYTMRLNLDNNITKNISIGTKTNFAYVKTELVQGANSGSIGASSSMMRSMINSKPYRSLKASSADEDEDDIDDEDEDDSSSGPDKWLKYTTNVRDEFRITPSAYFQWKIAPWLTYKTTFGADFRDTERPKFKSKKVSRTSTAGSTGAVAYVMSMKYNLDNLFLFSKKFKGGHELSGTLGMSASYSYSQTGTVEAWSIEQDKAKVNALNSAQYAAFRYSEGESSRLSYFVRGIYNYKNRYVLTSTFRLDGSSKFVGKNRYAPFPSMAFAWRINEEPWFNASSVSMAKLRLGWGQVGNQSVSNYQTVPTFSSSTYPDHNPSNLTHYVVDISPSNIANSMLKWETTEQINLGLDYSMWKGRLAISADAYRKVTYDLLQAKSVAISSGFSSVWVNEGTIENRGLEFTLDATPIQKKKMELGIEGNISFNRNKIVSIVDDPNLTTIYLAPGKPIEADYFLGSALGVGGVCSNPANIFIAGYPMGLFYGWKVDGMVGVGEEGVPESEGGAPRKPGSPNFVDLNGNGFIDNDDRCIIGDPNPDFTYGFGANFRYRDLTLSMSFHGVYGNDICSVTMASLRNVTKTTQNHPSWVLYDSWTPENPDARYPAIGRVTSNDIKKITSLDIYDGSFLRLSDISLSYNFPIPKHSKVVKGLNLSATLGNVYVWTSYQGWDPEVNSFGTDIKRMGIDSGSYPKARTLSFDVRFTF